MFGVAFSLLLFFFNMHDLLYYATFIHTLSRRITISFVKYAFWMKNCVAIAFFVYYSCLLSSVTLFTCHQSMFSKGYLFILMLPVVNLVNCHGSVLTALGLM